MTYEPAACTGVAGSFLELLHCPYCGGRLSLETADPRQGVRYGLLRCACHEYPVVEGIPILQQMDGLHRVTQLVQAADRRGALLRALDLFRVQWAQRTKLHRLKYHWNCSRLVSRSSISFADAAQWVRRPSVFADYLVHRYANPSFMAAIGPLMVLARAASAHAHGACDAAHPVRILDLACGAGHASHVMRLLRPELSVVSADQDFVNLYLARRYLVPDGLHLCIDAQVPSPFPDEFFDAVYCQDAFHYFRSKKAAVEELKRVAVSNALWVFPHLHNRLCHNLVPGLPLSPQGYLQCFDLPGATLFSESELLRALVVDRVVDLRETPPIASLTEVPNLTLMAGSQALGRCFEDFPQAFCRQASTLQINPIYRSHAEGDGLRLERHWPNPVMARECAEAQTVLAPVCRISGEQLRHLRAGWTGPHPDWLNDLVARFVLVPLPRGYTRTPMVRDQESQLGVLAGSRSRLA